MNGPDNPIGWCSHTWNPVKGLCPIACDYCVSGDTWILMSDSSWKQMKDIKVDDNVIGIDLVPVNEKVHRKFTKTLVKNKWQREAEAVEFTCNNGIQIFSTVCSLDHKWMCADHHRWLKASIINLNTKLEAIKTIFTGVTETDDYKKGYLSGLINGDASMAIYDDKRPNIRDGKVYSFRLAMNDKEAIDRAEQYLKDFDIIPARFLFKDEPEYRMPAIRTSSFENWHKIATLISYKNTTEYLRGYLGGIYDAEGSMGKDRHKTIRISNTDQEIIKKIEETFSLFGFNFAKEERENEGRKKLLTIRLLGGRGEALRLFNLIRPIITRKTGILNGGNIKGRADILAIKRVGTQKLFDIETGTGNFIANTLISHNCYARRIYQRFHYDPVIRLDEKELLAPYKLKDPAKIFVGSTIELFIPQISDEWIERILNIAADLPQHTFLFLSKFPINMDFNFPKNCWCGVTITNDLEWPRAVLLDDVNCPVHFVSFEPLHSFISAPVRFLDWVIIGAETGNRKGKVVPQEDWIAHIVDQADYWNIPIFMKDNLKPYWPDKLRQKFPKAKQSEEKK